MLEHIGRIAVDHEVRHEVRVSQNQIAKALPNHGEGRREQRANVRGCRFVHLRALRAPRMSAIGTMVPMKAC